MGESNTSRMIRLLRRLKKETNGAVVEAMERRGIHYPLSYGVSIPTIQAIAKEYGPDHSFALYLFSQQVRELQLAAVFIDDPQQITLLQMQQWSGSFVNTEIAEQSAAWLLWKAPCAPEAALRWAGDGTTPLLTSYAGLMMISKFVRPERITPRKAEEAFEAVRAAAQRSDLNATLAHGTVSALRQCALYSPEIRETVKKLLETFAASESQWLSFIAGETLWQIEEL